MYVLAQHTVHRRAQLSGFRKRQVISWLCGQLSASQKLCSQEICRHWYWISLSEMIVAFLRYGRISMFGISTFCDWFQRTWIKPRGERLLPLSYYSEDHSQFNLDAMRLTASVRGGMRPPVIYCVTLFVYSYIRYSIILYNKHAFCTGNWFRCSGWFCRMQSITNIEILFVVSVQAVTGRSVTTNCPQWCNGAHTIQHLMQRTAHVRRSQWRGV